MKQWVIARLKQLTAWLEGPPLFDDRMTQVALLMSAQDSIAGRSGEAKRHQVLAVLLKSGMSESDAAMTIERVVQARQGVRWVRT